MERPPAYTAGGRTYKVPEVRPTQTHEDGASLGCRMG